MALHALFFAWGISSLACQVVWVRQFGLVFGNMVYSASTVLAILQIAGRESG
jgi:hypothetical protein